MGGLCAPSESNVIPSVERGTWVGGVPPYVCWNPARPGPSLDARDDTLFERKARQSASCPMPHASLRMRIALLTDFGTRDPYVASMKGVIAARTEAAIHDLSHEIEPFDVFGAAWFLK